MGEITTSMQIKQESGETGATNKKSLNFSIGHVHNIFNKCSFGVKICSIARVRARNEFHWPSPIEL